MNSKLSFHKQEKAVKHRGNPLLIIAGPGTGKSTTLRERVKSLLKEDNCKEIVLISFTNASADDLQRELKRGKITDEKVKVFTLHKLAKYILHRNPKPVRLRDGFIVASAENEEKFVAGEAINELGLDWSTQTFVETLNKFKATGDQKILAISGFIDIMKRYEELLSYYNATDFHGLILLVCDLLHNHDKDKHRIQNLLVDEYQDLNPMEQKAIKLLAGDSKGLVVVGDDDQSIYGFKHADYKGILNFKHYYPTAEVIEFEESGRCPQKILDVAQAVISKNPSNTRYPKKLISVSEVQPGEVFLINCPQSEAEAKFIADKIKELHTESIPYDRFLVLCYGGVRGEIVKGLEQAGIPVIIRQSRKMDPDIWKIYLYARAVANPLDSLAIHQCLLYLSSFQNQKQILSDIRKDVEKNKKHLWEFLKIMNPTNILSNKQEEQLKKFRRDVELVRITQKEKDVETSSKVLMNRFKLSKKMFLPFRKLIGEGKIKNFKELVGAIQDQEGVLEKEAQEKPDQQAGAVQIMSIHSAKGLTAEVVFVPGFEEDTLPQHRANIEEQRRLFYVAVTRARKQVYFLHARMRKGRAARGQFAFPKISSFIDEIPSDLLNVIRIPSKNELRK